MAAACNTCHGRGYVVGYCCDGGRGMCGCGGWGEVDACPVCGRDVPELPGVLGWAEPPLPLEPEWPAEPYPKTATAPGWTPDAA